MYNTFMTNMNHSLSAYMESNIQASSQKRVNRPSDDPVNAGRILDTRATLSTLAMYEENCKMAMGWLSLADSILGSGDGSVHTVLSLIKTLDIQTSTGTINQDNRLQVAAAVREYMGQLVALANTKFGNQHIFAGHVTDSPPYHMGLGVTVKDPAGDLAGVQYHVEGASTSTVLITPVTSGPADTATYMFSTDGGKSWRPIPDPNNPSAGVSGTEVIDPKTGFVTRHVTTIETGTGVKVEISNPAPPGTAPGTAPIPNVTAKYLSPLSEAVKTDEGTWLYVRPTAVYTGDDNNTQVTTQYWNSAANRDLLDPNPTKAAQGHFTRDVAVRLDKIENGRLVYSFSADNGNNWTEASVPMPAAPITQPLRLPVPGGYLTIGQPDPANPGQYILPQANDPADPSTGLFNDMGTQIMIHPHRADIQYQIGDNDYITVNMVGKDIFGGLYRYSEDPNYPHAQIVPGPNMFETLGKLIAGLETNDQNLVQSVLPELDAVMSLVLTRTAEVGGRQNRLIVTQGALIMRTYSEQDHLSQMEDVDITELMTRLAQQQIAYNSVLKSSSMIMQMSLVNFL
jgi:flagellar hook-associated protein 3 FlgL